MKTLRRMIAKLRGAADIDRRDADIAREMQAHLDFATAEFIRRGMDPVEARRAALIDAGGLVQAQEAYRDQYGIPILQSVERNVRHALRGLRRNRSYSLAIVLSLALGIGLNTAIFAVADAVVRRPLPYPDADRIVTFAVSIVRPEGQLVMWEPYNALEAWRKNRSVGPVADFSAHSAVVQGDAASEYVQGASASANLLQVLRIRPLLGRWFADGEGYPSVAISEGLWRRQFARDTAIVGRSIRIDGRIWRIVGVLPRGLGLPIGAEFWMPSRGEEGQAIARLPEELPPATVTREFEMLAPSVANNRKRGMPASVIMVLLKEQLFGPARPTLRILFAAAIVLLLIACANVTNLVLARTLERRRELALRMALGASGRSLGTLVVLENVILTLAGGALGVALAVVTSRLLTALAPPSIILARDVGVQPVALLFAAGLVLACCFVVSIVPVLHVARQSANDVIGNSARSGPTRSMKATRRALVVAQLALALVLLTESGLLIRSIRRLTRPERLGFSPRGVVILDARLFGDRYRADADRQAFMDRLLTRVRGLPGVDNVTVGPPPAVGGSGERGLQEGFSMIFTYQREPSSPMLTLWAKAVDENYAATFGTRLRSGRFFRATDDSAAPKVVLLNTSAVRVFFGTENPVGRPLPPSALSQGKTPGPTVIGLVEDALQMDISIDARPEVLMPVRQSPMRPHATIAVHSSIPSAALAPMLHAALRELDPALAASRLESMDDVVNESLARHRFVLRLLFIFAGLGVVLSAIGLYAVISYFVSQRTAEFGVRLALGARRDHLIRLVLSEGMAMIVIGIVIAVPATLASGRLLATLLYQARMTDPAAFLGGAGILSLVAAAASFVPARRAGSVDPARALRAE